MAKVTAVPVLLQKVRDEINAMLGRGGLHHHTVEEAIKFRINCHLEQLYSDIEMEHVDFDIVNKGGNIDVKANNLYTAALLLGHNVRPIEVEGKETIKLKPFGNIRIGKDGIEIELKRPLEYIELGMTVKI